MMITLKSRGKKKKEIYMKGKVQKRDIYFRLTTKQTTSNTVLAVIIELTNITYSTSERRKIQTKKKIFLKSKW